MTIERTVNKLLTNKYVLYFVLVVCVIQILCYIKNQHTDSLLIFILAGILCNCMTKNMTVILLTAFAVSKILHITVREGMKNKKKGKNGEEIDIEVDIKNLPSKKTNEDNGDEDDDNGEDDNGEEYDGEDDDDDDDNDYDSNYNSKKNYQKTREESYKNLNKFLDSGEFSKMNKDTKQLINNQDKLAGTMKTLAPMIKNAQNMLKGFNLDKLTGLLGNNEKGK